jgi:cytoskeleton protein RodZ
MRDATSQDHDPAESLMREVGAQLRQVRLQRGEDLDDVAHHLRIRSSYLFGIEQGDLSGMPGRTYALGFLRSYADYLGFDGEDLISRIKSTVENLTDHTRLRMRTPVPENRLPRTPILVMSLAAVAGIYAGWSYLNRTSRTVVDTVAEVPSDLRPRASETAAQGADQGSPRPTPTQAADGAAAAGGPAADVASTADAPPRAAQSAASGGPAAPLAATGAPTAPGPVAAPEAGPLVAERASPAEGSAPDALAVQPAAGATPDVAAGANPAGGVLARVDPTADDQNTPQVHGRDNADARVILRAREPAWIQVSSPSGDYTFTRTLEPGEALMVPNRADLELWTGNAGGLEIMVDGAPVPALAGSGAVRRHVSLDPERLLRSAPQRR